VRDGKSLGKSVSWFDETGIKITREIKALK
jgi:hypothetical protein